jgi:quinol monooxygenase YgiN
MSEPKVLFAEIVARAGHEAEVASMLAEHVAAVRAESGNQLFEAASLIDRPGSFFVYERYRDEEAFEAHLSSPHSVDFNLRLSPLVEGGGSRLTWLQPLTS